jgi:hypothetical protein
MKSQNTSTLGIAALRGSRKINKAVLLVVLLWGSQCWADPVWHCSRNGLTSKGNILAQAEQFSLASMGSSEDVIGVSIRDLIDVYSGTHVKVGGEPLSACFISGEDTMTASALKSLGLKPVAIQALARKSTIVQSHLYLVTDEVQMKTCIAKHFPAVGYLSEPTETEHFMPCF